MQAKSGPQPKKIRLTRNFQAPPKPKGLTPSQEASWEEVIANPYLTSSDASTVADYMQAMVLRDKAFAKIDEHGVFVDDAKGSIKTNPAYKIYRDANNTVLKLRAVLLMTPQSRIQAKNIETTEQEETSGIGALAD